MGAGNVGSVADEAGREGEVERIGAGHVSFCCCGLWMVLSVVQAVWFVWAVLACAVLGVLGVVCSLRGVFGHPIPYVMVGFFFVLGRA